jgi:hypothetical protein
LVFSFSKLLAAEGLSVKMRSFIVFCVLLIAGGEYLIDNNNQAMD